MADDEPLTLARAAGALQGFGGLVRSTDQVDRDGPPISWHDEKRLVEHKSGLKCWVTITQRERKRYIDMIPKGWNHVVRDREAGMSVAQLAQKYRMETEFMRDYLALAYGWVEQRLFALAEHKAGAKPIGSRPTDGTVESVGDPDGRGRL